MGEEHKTQTAPQELVFDAELEHSFKIYIDKRERGNRVRIYLRPPRPPRPPKIKPDSERKRLTTAEVEQALLGLVNREPGRGRSFYEQLSPKHGGVAAAQKTREQAFQRLLDTHRVRLVPLPKPLGRKNHAVYPA